MVVSGESGEKWIYLKSKAGTNEIILSVRSGWERSGKKVGRAM